jgi:TRAP-type C4-dicarboxylate transport system permease small subunit
MIATILCLIIACLMFIVGWLYAYHQAYKFTDKEINDVYMSVTYWIHNLSSPIKGITKRREELNRLCNKLERMMGWED